MLLSSKSHVKLTKNYLKILYLSTASNGTFTFLGMQSTGKDVIVHCDVQGKILFEKVFEHNVDSFGMLSNNEVIVLETRLNRISILNLETHEWRYVGHHFFNQQSDQAEIQTFSETHYLCVKQFGRYNDSHLKLSYYSHPIKEGDKPFRVFDGQDNQWTYDYTIKKANNHSMIAWFKSRHDEQFMVKTYDLRDQEEGKYNEYHIKNTIGNGYNLNKIECAISSLWEMSAGKFCAVTISNKFEAKAINKAGVVNNNFIIDVVAGTVRETNFSFDQKHNDYLIDYHYLGQFCMFRTFNFVEGKVASSPVYYINNEAEEIVYTDEWKCTYLTKYFTPGFDGSLLIESEYENSDVKQFTIMQKKVMDPKQIALFFLLHLNQAFDDDLLQDAINLLQFK